MEFRAAVGKTIAYSAFFKFSLFPKEIHYWLISPQKVSYSSLRKYLPVLNQKQIKIRNILQKNTLEKEQFAFRFIKYARFIPGIRLIALTGSVAINNSKTKDDLDLLIITAPNSLWLIRPLMLILLSIIFNRRHPGDNPKETNNAFCPNLWLDTKSLTVPKKRRNLYTAHEVLQIKPLLDRGNTYLNFIRSNSWVKYYLANAYSSVSEGTIPKEKFSWLTIIIYPLNYLMFIFQYLYMLPKKTTETVSLHSAFFHKNDPSASIENYLKNLSL